MAVTKDVIIKVRSVDDLSKVKDGSVLVFDKSHGYYYVVDHDDLMKECESKISQALRIQNQTSEKESVFEKKMNERFESFLSAYKETNTKLIDLVDSVVNSKYSTEGK